MLGQGAAVAITAKDIEELAIAEGWHPAVIEAIAQVESQGFGWFPDGRMKILNEHHWFYKLVRKDRRAEAVRQGVARKNWISPKRGGYKDQIGADARYAQLEKKMKLDRSAAIQSISMGRFQIMGFNWKKCGFASPEDMWEKFLASEVWQLMAFKNFIVNSGLRRAVEQKDFQKVEEVYNGGGLNGVYARKMTEAYQKLINGKWKGWYPTRSEARAPQPSVVESTPPVVVAVEPDDVSKPAAKSTINWAAAGGFVTAVFGAISGLNPWVAAAVILVAAGFAFWIIKERMGITKAVEKAAAVAAGKTL